MATTWRNQVRSHSDVADHQLTSTNPTAAWTIGGLIIVIVAIVMANVLYVVGKSNPDAIGWTSNVVHLICRHGLCLQPAIDPNVGFITQAEGHLAAMDWLHLHVPWWNPFTGLGAPLAGEMQSGALSPLVLLFALPGGLLWFHVALELIGGISTYLLVRRLLPTELLACLGGILFGLNGTFAWLGNSVENPVCYLPLALLGVECIVRGVGRKRWGWGLLAIAIALGMYAGFPEVAALDDLLVLAYAVVRGFTLPRASRWDGVRQLVMGLGVGGLLSLPILVAFKDYLKVALIGIHANASALQLPLKILPMFIDPYIYGDINAYHSASPYWGGVGGYFTMGVFLLALFGLTGPTQRALRWTLGGWVLLSLLGATNTLGVHVLWDLVPGLSQIVLGRYIIASCEMAMILLALMGLDDLIARRRTKRDWLVASAVSLVLLVTVLLWVSGVTAGLSYGRFNTLMLIVGRMVPFVSLGLITYAGLLKKTTLVAGLVTLALVGEAFFSFGLPEIFAPYRIITDQPAITFLQKNLGLNRFVSAGPLSPNWGTYFSINQLNAHDLPFPADFANFVDAQLPLGAAQSPFMYMVYKGVSESATYETSMATHLATFENAGVKYLTVFRDRPVSPALLAKGLTKVYADDFIWIYQFPHPQPFYTAVGCTTSQISFASVRVTCPHPSTLVRRELFMPGWSARVNGAGVSVSNWSTSSAARRSIPGTPAPYQIVSVPSGTSTVDFSFRPPHELLAEGGFLVGLGALGWAWRRNRPTSASRGRRRAPRRFIKRSV